MSGTSEQRPLAVGFDLDMTLIDTVPGFAHTLRALGAELGVEFPVEDMTARLGPPLESLLAPHLEPDAVGPAGDRFRAIYPEHAIRTVPALPGTHEALAAVRAHQGRIVLVTGKLPENARRHVAHLSLDVDLVEGWVWGVGKAEVLRREGVSVYVGDHVHDVEGALAAGATSVSVLTGGCTRAELEAAGTHVVLESLLEFPDWLEEHLLEVRLARLDAELRAHGSVLVAYSGGADSALEVVDVEGEVVDVALRVGPELAGHDDDPPAAVANGGQRLVRPGERRHRDDRVVDVELAEPLDRRRDRLRRDVAVEHVVQRRPQPLGHLLGRERDPQLLPQRQQRRREPRPGVDEGHVEVEPDDEVTHPASLRVSTPLDRRRGVSTPLDRRRGVSTPLDWRSRTGRGDRRIPRASGPCGSCR